MSYLSENIWAASFLCKSESAKDALLLQQILEKLHRDRSRYPQYERYISSAIFKIHDTAFYGQSDLMRQKAHVATICGFDSVPTKDMVILKELLKRMPLVKKPQTMSAAFQSVLNKIVNAYTSQNYQKKDHNLQTAYQLKQLVHMVYPFAKKQNQQQKIHDSAVALEKAIPTFKGLAARHPVTVVTKTPRVSVKEAVQIAVPMIYARTIRSSYGDF